MRLIYFCVIIYPNDKRPNPNDKSAGGLCHVVSQQPLLHIQSSAQVLAGAWTQLLADSSRLIESQEATTPEYHRCLALYSEAINQHEVRELDINMDHPLSNMHHKAILSVLNHLTATLFGDPRL